MPTAQILPTLGPTVRSDATGRPCPRAPRRAPSGGARPRARRSAAVSGAAWGQRPAAPRVTLTPRDKEKSAWGFGFGPHNQAFSLRVARGEPALQLSLQEGTSI